MHSSSKVGVKSPLRFLFLPFHLIQFNLIYQTMHQSWSFYI